MNKWHKEVLVDLIYLNLAALLLVAGLAYGPELAGLITKATVPVMALIFGFLGWLGGNG